jgi:hypothetical protein
MVSDFESYNSSVVKIQNGAQIHLANLRADIILELRYISKPFLVRSISVKISVQIILCDMCRIIAVSGTTLRLPLDCRLDMLFTADPQNPFIIDIDVIMPVQFIPYPAISHIRMLFMDNLDRFRNLLISLFTVTYRFFQPAVIGPSR